MLFFISMQTFYQKGKFEFRRKMADPVKLKETGNEYFKSGDFKEALSFYTKALDAGSLKDLERAVIYKNKAACYLKMDKNQEAYDNATSCKNRENPLSVIKNHLYYAENMLQEFSFSHIIKGNISFVKCNRVLFIFRSDLFYTMSEYTQRAALIIVYCCPQLSELKELIPSKTCLF